MFDQKQLERAIDLQQRSHHLLKWLAGAVRQGLIRFATAHSFASFSHRAALWLEEHRQIIPPDARPEPEDLTAFANFFSTFLENSYDLDPAPGKRLYSPEAHCFCPLCSWLIDAPNLKTKKLRLAHKKLAKRLCVEAVQNLALQLPLVITDTAIEQLLVDETTNENACLVAYGFDLLSRLNGIANGPAVLALWRGFAWYRSGSPKRDFHLTATLIMNAETQIRHSLQTWKIMAAEGNAHKTTNTY